MTHADSDGVNDMVEGAHRALGTGLARWTEMLAWRGRDRADDENGAPLPAEEVRAAAAREDLVDYPARAELHARTHAQLDSREFFDDTDSDATLSAWASSRDTTSGTPPAGSPHWRQWTLLEATDEQIEQAHTAVSDQVDGSGA